MLSVALIVGLSRTTGAKVTLPVPFSTPKPSTSMFEPPVVVSELLLMVGVIVTSPKWEENVTDIQMLSPFGLENVLPEIVGLNSSPPVSSAQTYIKTSLPVDPVDALPVTEPPTVPSALVDIE